MVKGLPFGGTGAESPACPSPAFMEENPALRLTVFSRHRAGIRLVDFVMVTVIFSAGFIYRGDAISHRHDGIRNRRVFFLRILPDAKRRTVLFICRKPDDCSIFQK